MRIPVIHIGAAKAGSKFLQTELLDRNPEITRLGMPYISKQDRNIVNSIKWDDDYDCKSSEFREYINRAREEADRENKLLVFTDESLTSPGQKSAIARRLKSVFQEAKILLIIRNQFDSIVSYYAKHGRILKKVPDTYCGRYVPFDDWFHYCTENSNGTHFDRINYLKIYKIYSELFGKENVRVLCYEMLRESPESFIKKLFAELEVEPGNIFEYLSARPVNTRSTVLQHQFQKLRTRFLWRKSLLGWLPISEKYRQYIRNSVYEMLKYGKPDTVTLDDEKKVIINKIYGSGNKQLSEMLNLQLEKYSYPMEDLTSG